MNCEELERRLFEAQQRISELERELSALRANLSKSTSWQFDQRISNEWLTRTVSDVSADNELAMVSRLRGKTVIDSSVIEELRIEKKDIQLKEHIGKGSFGIVWKANYRDVNVAVKVFISEELDVSREVSTMAKTKGLPHILDLIGVVLEEDDPYKPSQIALVMKYMSNGSLQDICYKESNSYHSNLSNEMKLKFSYQAAKGVLNLHSKNIIHRDLACRNLLVDDKLDIYVADFGFARLKHVTTSKEFTATKLGPVRWEAPESLERKEYSEKTDSFSFGVCIYEIITGKQPWDFCTTPTMVAVNVLRGNRLYIPINCDPILADLAWNCWHENPVLRPTFPKMVSVLSDRYKQVLEDTRAIEKELLCVEFMIVGVDVLKYPFIKVDEKFRLKKPQNRYLRLKSNLKSLVWRSSTANNVFSSASRNKVVERGIEIKDILEVKVGFATENFRLQTGHHASSLSVSCSFSIVTANRSLDITCESSSHRDLWVWGVRYLLNRHRESQSAGNRLISELKLFYFSSQQAALHSLQRLTLVSLPANPSSFQSHEYLNLLRYLVYRLQRGDIIVKFKSNRKVHAKRIFLSPDLTEIVWNMKDEEENANKRPKNKSILLAEIESVSYDPPNFFFGNSRVAAVAANLSESLLRRHHTASSSSLNAQGASSSGPLTSDRISKKDRASSETFDTSSIPEKKTRPRKNSQDSVGTPTPGGQATSATWVQALIPSLKREKSEDPSAQQPHPQSHFQGSIASETDTDARPDDLDQEHGLHAEDIDAQYCISYLRHDGRILLAIQCPNRDVFELWTDGLTAIITGLKHTRNQTTAVTYNSGAEFTLPLPADSESSRHRLLTQVQPSSLLSSLDLTLPSPSLASSQNTFGSNHAVLTNLSRLDSADQSRLLSPSSEVTEVMHRSREVSFDQRDFVPSHREEQEQEQEHEDREEMEEKESLLEDTKHESTSPSEQQHYSHMKGGGGWLQKNSEPRDLLAVDVPILSMPPARRRESSSTSEYLPMKGVPELQQSQSQESSSSTGAGDVVSRDVIKKILSTADAIQYEHRLIDV